MERSRPKGNRHVANLPVAAVACGESLTNLSQSIFLFIGLLLVGAGIRILACDVVGYSCIS